MGTKQDTLKRIEIPGMGRFYQSPSSKEWFPSVTTVVNHADEEKWRKWREDPENQKISEAAISRGNRLHEVVENYLTKGELPQDIDRSHFDSIFPMLQDIGEIAAIEQTVWSDTLRMAGRMDCIGEYDGRLSVIDFKTSGKPKKKEWIQNYFQQAAAYSWMWEERTGEKAEQIVIMIATDTGKGQLFIENRDDHREALGATIKGYWKKNKFKDIQEKANGMDKKTSRS